MMMQGTYRARVQDVPQLRRGVCGIVDVLCHIAGEPEQWEEWCCLSSAAFKRYLYDARINPVQEGKKRQVSRRAEWFSNYGIFEALGYASGWQIKEFNFLSVADIVPLAAFELMHGRAVLSLGVGGALEPVAITGVDATATSLKLEVQRPKALEREVVDMWGCASLQGEDEDFFNWCVVARPGERASWAASQGKLRRDVLIWAVEHAHAPKEFFHETRANYAPGLSGAQVFARVMDMGLSGELEQDLGDFLRDHLEGLELGRASAGRRLEVWASELGQHEDEGWQDEARAREGLQQAGEAYALAARALEHWEVLVGGLEKAPDWRALKALYAASVAHEARAIAAIQGCL